MLVSTMSTAPAHNVFSFDDHVFSSNFDNGNLANVEKIGDCEYRIFTSPDCFGTEFQGKNCAWFHFTITGFSAKTTLRIHIAGAGNGNMYKNDMVFNFIFKYFWLNN